MDYMLLKSGEVLTFEKEHLSSDVPELFILHNGEGYYYLTDRGWYGMQADADSSLGFRKLENEYVPDIIKLAAMLQ